MDFISLGDRRQHIKKLVRSETKLTNKRGFSAAILQVGVQPQGHGADGMAGRNEAGANTDGGRASVGGGATRAGLEGGGLRVERWQRGRGSESNGRRTTTATRRGAIRRRCEWEGAEGARAGVIRIGRSKLSSRYQNKMGETNARVIRWHLGEPLKGIVVPSMRVS